MGRQKERSNTCFTARNIRRDGRGPIRKTAAQERAQARLPLFPCREAPGQEKTRLSAPTHTNYARERRRIRRFPDSSLMFCGGRRRRGQRPELPTYSTPGAMDGLEPEVRDALMEMVQLSQAPPAGSEAPSGTGPAWPHSLQPQLTPSCGTGPLPLDFASPQTGRLPAQAGAASAGPGSRKTRAPRQKRAAARAPRRRDRGLTAPSQASASHGKYAQSDLVTGQHSVSPHGNPGTGQNFCLAASPGAAVDAFDAFAPGVPGSVPSRQSGQLGPFGGQKGLYSCGPGGGLQKALSTSFLPPVGSAGWAGERAEVSNDQDSLVEGGDFLEACANQTLDKIERAFELDEQATVRARRRVRSPPGSYSAGAFGSSKACLALESRSTGRLHKAESGGIPGLGDGSNASFELRRGEAMAPPAGPPQGGEMPETQEELPEFGPTAGSLESAIPATETDTLLRGDASGLPFFEMVDEQEEEATDQGEEEYESTTEELQLEDPGYALTIHNTVYPDSGGALLLQPGRASMEETLGESATVIEWGEAARGHGELGTLDAVSDGESGGSSENGEELGYLTHPDVVARRSGHELAAGEEWRAPAEGAGGRSYLRVRAGARVQQPVEGPPREDGSFELCESCDQYRLSGVAEKR